MELETDTETTSTAEPQELPAYLVTWPAETIIEATIQSLAVAPSDCCHLLYQLHALARRLRSRPGLAGAVGIVVGVWRGSLPYNHTAQLALALDVSHQSARNYLAAIRRNPLLSKAVIWPQRSRNKIKTASGQLNDCI